MKITDLRFKPKEEKKPQKIFRQLGISNIEKLQETEKNILILSLMKSLSNYSTREKFSDTLEEFIEKIDTEIEYILVDYELNISIDNLNFGKVLEIIHDRICKKGNGFIGKLVEYFTFIQLSKYYSEVYYECYLHNKDICIHGEDPKFKDKVLDVISINNNEKILLCECKANLDSELYHLSQKRNNDLKRKIKLMEHLTEQLACCNKVKGNSAIDEFITVKPYFVTVAFNGNTSIDQFLENKHKIPKIEVLDFEKLIKIS